MESNLIYNWGERLPSFLRQLLILPSLILVSVLTVNTVIITIYFYLLPHQQLIDEMKQTKETKRAEAKRAEWSELSGVELIQSIDAGGL